MKVYDKLFINGDWVSPAGKGAIDVIDAGSEAVMGRIPEGTPEDIDRAVKAAKAAFPAWAAKTPAERAEYLNKISAGLMARAEGMGSWMWRTMTPRAVSAV